MEVTLTKSDVDALAKRIAEYLWEDIPKEAIPDKPKQVKEVAEPVKVAAAEKDVSETAREVAAVKQEEVAAVKQEEEVAAKQEETAKPQITTAELRKAVMEFTRNNQDNLTKTKEILSGMGIEQLSQLEGDLINQFVEKFVAIGGKI